VVERLAPARTAVLTGRQAGRARMPRLPGEEVYTASYRATASTEALWIPGPALSRVMLIVSIHLSRWARVVAGGWSIAITMPRRLP